VLQRTETFQYRRSAIPPHRPMAQQSSVKIVHVTERATGQACPLTEVNLPDLPPCPSRVARRTYRDGISDAGRSTVFLVPVQWCKSNTAASLKRPNDESYCSFLYREAGLIRSFTDLPATMRCDDNREKSIASVQCDWELTHAHSCDRRRRSRGDTSVGDCLKPAGV